MRYAWLITAGILGTACVAASLCVPVVRREVAARMGGHTVEQRVEEVAPRVRGVWEGCIPAGVTSVRQVVLVVLKRERELRVFVTTDSGTTCVATYPVFAASGTEGPKLREGDNQVPEGMYAVSFLNPNSRFHLSLRVDYPNTADVLAAQQDGRDTTSLGGDIMIHGGAKSIGCVAIGDPAIEEIFWLVATVGLGRTRVVLSPREHPLEALKGDEPAWVRERYREVEAELRTLGVGGGGG